MPGYVQQALDEAASYLEARKLSDAITAATYPALCNAAFREESPDHSALEAVEQIRDRIGFWTSGKTYAEDDWEKEQAFRRMPGVRFIPKHGVGNG